MFEADDDSFIQAFSKNKLKWNIIFFKLKLYRTWFKWIDPNMFSDVQSTVLFKQMNYNEIYIFLNWIELNNWIEYDTCIHELIKKTQYWQRQ